MSDLRILEFFCKEGHRILLPIPRCTCGVDLIVDYSEDIEYSETKPYRFEYGYGFRKEKHIPEDQIKVFKVDTVKPWIFKLTKVFPQFWWIWCVRNIAEQYAEQLDIRGREKLGSRVFSIQEIISEHNEYSVSHYLEHIIESICMKIYSHFMKEL